MELPTEQFLVLFFKDLFVYFKRERVRTHVQWGGAEGKGEDLQQTPC